MIRITATRLSGVGTRMTLEASSRRFSRSSGLAGLLDVEPRKVPSCRWKRDRCGSNGVVRYLALAGARKHTPLVRHPDEDRAMHEH